MKTAKIVLLFLLLAAMPVTVASDCLRRIQSRGDASTEGVLKLKYATGDLTDLYEGIPKIDPVALPDGRSLHAVGDMLYMIDASNHVLWEFSVEPAFIYDVTTDCEGLIYLAVFDGSVGALNNEGELIWSNFMNGSANYTQLERYQDGILSVISMEAYRTTKGSDGGDILVFWRNREEVWRKPFPANARLNVLGDRIVGVRATKDGNEVTEVR